VLRAVASYFHTHFEMCERDVENECAYVSALERERVRERVSVCLRKRERVCVFCKREMERTSVLVCRERGKEREIVILFCV